jgi:hypothetical protein
LLPFNWREHLVLTGHSLKVPACLQSHCPCCQNRSAPDCFQVGYKDSANFDWFGGEGEKLGKGMIAAGKFSFPLKRQGDKARGDKANVNRKSFYH